MEPSARPGSKRRAVAMSSYDPAPVHKYSSDISPSPFTSNPKSIHTSTEISTSRPNAQTVALEWDDDNDGTSSRTSRLQIELAECVETKTVTTTTTTKRAYPPLLFRQQPLAALDPKEYPLIAEPIPEELKKISYELNTPHMFSVDESRASPPQVLRDQTVATSAGRSTRKHDLRGAQQYKSIAVEKSELPRAEYLHQKLASINQRRSRYGAPEFRPTSPSSSAGKACKPDRATSQQMQNSRSGEHEAPRTGRQGLGRYMAEHTTFPATPDMSELETSNLGRSRTFSNSPRADTPQSTFSRNDSFEAINDDLQDIRTQEPFANAVATPPVAESDLEPLNNTDASFANGSGPRSVNTALAQNASLPSPGLSPTFASAELHRAELEEAADSPATQPGDTQESFEDYEEPQDQVTGPPKPGYFGVPSLMDTRSMLETFDAMPNDMKTLMMFRMLQRCPKKTLHTLADAIYPALQCDFIKSLPTELSLHILSFLSYKDLCRAAQVSKYWRATIDSNETGWKELFDQDGYVLPIGELEKAIHQGWGWQDPYGPDGCEQDWSVRPASALDNDMSFYGSVKLEEPTRKVRPTTKRKRLLNGGLSSDRAKRRSVGYSDNRHLSRNSQAPGYSKSEGPLSAANAAVLAVPDPQRGLPGMSKLHLFKSLYRRHHMLRNSWMSDEVKPHHFAFPAHPAHVITCLQFDDDKILTGSDDTLIHVYDTKTGALRKKLEGHEGGVWALQYEGNVLVSGSTDRSVRVWDIEKGLCTQVFHGHTSTVRCLQILMPEMTGETAKGKPIMVPEKPLIITGSRDSQLRVWKLPEQGSKRYIQSGPPANDADCPYFLRVLVGHQHSVRAIAAHRDTLVSGSYDNTVRVWKISTGETVHVLRGHTLKVYSVVLDHKRNRCISGSMDNYVKIWSLETGACLYTLEGHTSLVGLLDLRDERLVSAAADSHLRIWEPENGQCKSTLTAHTGAITCFQHDGQKVISGSDRTLKMWNIKTGECMKDLLTDLSGVWQVKFDERRCVAAVQRDSLTYLEVLDFGASRDGVPASERVERKLINFGGLSRPIIEEEEDP